MRGKEDGMKIRVDLDRITPAYAGKSVIIREQDCGATGSPPPMRGKD